MGLVTGHVEVGHGQLSLPRFGLCRAVAELGCANTGRISDAAIGTARWSGMHEAPKAKRCHWTGCLVILAASVLYPLAPSLWWLGTLHGIYGSAYDLVGIGPAIVFVTRLAQVINALCPRMVIFKSGGSGRSRRCCEGRGTEVPGAPHGLALRSD